MGVFSRPPAQVQAKQLPQSMTLSEQPLPAMESGRFLLMFLHIAAKRKLLLGITLKLLPLQSWLLAMNRN